MSKSGSLYIERQSVFHSLDGSIKLLMLIAWTFFAFAFMAARQSDLAAACVYLPIYPVQLGISAADNAGIRFKTDGDLHRGVSDRALLYHP